MHFSPLKIMRRKVPTALGSLSEKDGEIVILSFWYTAHCDHGHTVPAGLGQGFLQGGKPVEHSSLTGLRLLQAGLQGAPLGPSCRLTGVSVTIIVQKMTPLQSSY